MTCAGKAFAAVLLCFVMAAPSQSPEPRRFKRQLSPGETDITNITLAANQFLHIEVLQSGHDVAVALREPGGRVVVESDIGNGAYGPETVVFVAETSGSYSLEIKLGDLQAEPGDCEINILSVHKATAQDIKIVAAYRLFYQAERWRRDRSPAAPAHCDRRIC